MLSYYLTLALRSLRRSPALSALMVIAIALGVGASMTTLTLFRVLAGDPIPHKSAQLFNVQLDAERLLSMTPGGDPTLQLTRFDAEALLREARGLRQVMMTGAQIAVDPAGSAAPASAALPPFMASARWASSDFFAMFEAPLLHGRSWSAAEDQAKARVAVVSRALAEQLFGQSDALGRTLRLRDKDLTIIGVLADWRPAPHYFDLTLGAYESAAQIFAPLQTALDLDLGRSGDTTCWATAQVPDTSALNAPCAWLQYWVELKDPTAAADYLAYLQRYSEQQRSVGRFERPSNPRLTPVMQWLAKRQVVPSDIRLQLWLALGFLLVCLSNTVGLLLAKCLRRSGEIGVRRALGASKRAIFWQFLVEAGVLGLAGGLLGLALTWAGLAAIRLNPTPYAQLAQLDWAMLSATLAVALAAALAAGLLPAWRACQITPAIQLKAQ
ncbi:ABC transporter permease [Paucibacter sp. PLA-PC-4]|uniref:ABC transporter permease n=1 Tax=Paucibacter sp. PLA-PC-4 TaxID=2993655 RepID=UPI00224B0379|nr:ABC transporter permease [Paucibacter sp. PLA-PC-4]MCX2863906.1 ABC transporter permease [Paucibacter sp. PLA-PC-4]